jgi:hypothetical protein
MSASTLTDDAIARVVTPVKIGRAPDEIVI